LIIKALPVSEHPPHPEPPAYLQDNPTEYPPDYFRQEESASHTDSADFQADNANAEIEDFFGGAPINPSPPSRPFEEISHSTRAEASANRLHFPAGMIDTLIRGLNQEQHQAVTAPSEHVLVLAGAGSGKTRVLTHRLAWLLANGSALPAQVLAVTFTNKAAKEMTHRLQSIGIRQTYAMWIGTFHGLCHRFLRQHYTAAGLSQTFQVMDTDEQISIVRQVMEDKKVNGDEFPPRDLMNWINSKKEKGDRAATLENSGGFGRDLAIQIEVYSAYEAFCHKENRVDFAELLLRTLEVLERHESLRNQYQERFRHLLVDEFQDTNAMQYRLLQLFCGTKACIFAVGDDDQSIYGFRGAKVENLRDFERKFARGRVIRLEQSYRSTSTILKAANQVIANNTGRLGKTLWTAQSGGEKIRIYPAYNDEEEARWMMSEMRKLGESEGIPWSDMAILYRINAHSRSFEQAAIQAGIPYRITGGFRFYERAEIRHALAYLRLIANPHDEMSLLRVINFPPRGIGERTIELLRETAQLHRLSLMGAISKIEGRNTSVLMAFASTIYQLKQNIQGMELPDIIALVIANSGLQIFFQNQRDGKERLENLAELQNAASQYAAEWKRRMAEGEFAEVVDSYTGEVNQREATDNPLTAPSASRLEVDNPTLFAPTEPPGNPLPIGDLGTGEQALVHFLTDAVLDSAESESSQKSAINMMSVHAAKGLEFTTVFIGGLEHGTFPHENNQDVEEERRLMYVALTRAKKHLYLSYTHQRLQYGRVQFKIPSQFLMEIPESLTTYLRPPASAASLEDSRQQRFGATGRFGHSGKGNSTAPTQHPSTGGSTTPVRDFDKALRHLGVSKGLPNAPVEADATPPFALGAKVRHAKFGEGIVWQYEGMGKDTRILVSFGGLGQKWLVLSLAKLAAAD
jgi:DNA helicase-2/ATP-dependent DNA helicase PcrA